VTMQKQSLKRRHGRIKSSIVVRGRKEDETSGKKEIYEEKKAKVGGQSEISISVSITVLKKDQKERQAS